MTNTDKPWTLTARDYRSLTNTMTATIVQGGMTASVLIDGDGASVTFVHAHARMEHVCAEAARLVAVAYDTIGDLASESPLDLMVDSSQIAAGMVRLVGEASGVLSGFFDVDLV